MFDFYRNGQPVAVSIFEKAIKEDKLSHAYLIDTNNYSLAFDFVLSFVKEIIGLNIKDKNEREAVFLRIDEGNYTELKIIEADGNWIKKEQMVNLQEDFSLKGIEGNKRIYIIKDCEKMNVQTSNSILKFLEEPEEDIIAILMSNNISQLLETIISRCQFVRFNSDKAKNNKTIDNLCDIVCSSKIEKEKFLSDEGNKKLIDNFIYFIKIFEDNGLSVIVDIKKLWHDKFDNRDYVNLVIDLWINFYYDILKLKTDNNNIFFVEYVEDLKYILKLHNYDEILDKLNILIEAKSNLKYNLNLNLFVDKIIIDLVGER